jgi:2-polyprenyl-3-methyl-5-hydroxy-6-metoxy-1,4-benzoquinol methylase
MKTPTDGCALESVRSWIANAKLWTDAVRSGGIASRTLATDAAVVNAVLARRPACVLDLGCGEGWLARQLGAQGISVVGADVSTQLVDAARTLGSGKFHVLDYQSICANPQQLGTAFNTIVANFSLLDDSLTQLLSAVTQIIAADGALILQTLHPAAVGPPYRDGWRIERFRAFGEGADWVPMPWYFRTIGSWYRLISVKWKL